MLCHFAAHRLVSYDDVSSNKDPDDTVHLFSEKEALVEFDPNSGFKWGMGTTQIYGNHFTETLSQRRKGSPNKEGSLVLFSRLCILLATS